MKRENPRPVRKLRHWKQQFDPRAKFVWRKNLRFAGEQMVAGDIVPDGLLKPTKLRRFWESGIIELAEFETPDVATGRPKAPVARHLGGGWYSIKFPGEDEPVKIKGREAAAKAVRAWAKRAGAGAGNE